MNSDDLKWLKSRLTEYGYWQAHGLAGLSYKNKSIEADCMTYGGRAPRGQGSSPQIVNYLGHRKAKEVEKAIGEIPCPLLKMVIWCEYVGRDGGGVTSAEAAAIICAVSKRTYYRKLSEAHSILYSKLNTRISEKKACNKLAQSATL